MNDTERNNNSGPYLRSSMLVGLTSLYVITLVTAFLGNALSLVIVYRRRSFRNTMNLLIMNMCIADMLVALVVIPFALAYFYHPGQWFAGVAGNFACKFSHYASVVSISASILTILFISCERFIAICYPLKGRFLRRPKVITILIWLLSLVLMSPYLVIYKNLQGRDGKWYCIEEFGNQDEMPKYMKIHYLLLFILLYAYPLLVIAILNSAIICKLARQQIPGEVNAGSSSGPRKLAMRHRRKAVKMLIALLIVFAVCWFPTHLMHYFIILRRDILYSLPKVLPHLLFWFGYFNSALNPCIYVLFSDNFRRDFKLLFCRPRRKRSQLTVRMTVSEGFTSRDRTGSGLGKVVRRWSESFSLRSSGHKSPLPSPASLTKFIELENTDKYGQIGQITEN